MDQHRGCKIWDCKLDFFSIFHDQRRNVIVIKTHQRQGHAPIISSFIFSCRSWISLDNLSLDWMALFMVGSISNTFSTSSNEAQEGTQGNQGHISTQSFNLKKSKSIKKKLRFYLATFQSVLQLVHFFQHLSTAKNDLVQAVNNFKCPLKMSWPPQRRHDTLTQVGSASIAIVQSLRALSRSPCRQKGGSLGDQDMRQYLQAKTRK